MCGRTYLCIKNGRLKPCSNVFLLRFSYLKSLQNELNILFLQAFRLIVLVAVEELFRFVNRIACMVDAKFLQGAVIHLREDDCAMGLAAF